MKCFEDIKDTLGDDVDYINLVKYYLENFENIVKNKNPRRPKKNKNWLDIIFVNDIIEK